MSVYFTAPPTEGGIYRVRRSLSDTELDSVREHIHADVPGPRELVDTVVTAVFTALLADLGETYHDHERGEAFERGRYAIPVSQWTAIAVAVHDRAYTWGAAIAVGMDLAALMPGSYDDPAVATPQLGPVDGRPFIFRFDISRETADTIAACQAHLGALFDAYGIGSRHFQAASASWSGQLSRLFSSPLGARTVLHPGGPLSLYISTDGGAQHAIVFRPAPRRCTTEGCHAITETSTGADPQWQPASANATVLEHEHQPDYPFDGPLPGTWVANS
jgi:hypothetical protein